MLWLSTRFSVADIALARAQKATATIVVSAMLAALATRAEAGLEVFPATAEARIREDRVSAAVNGQPLPLVTRRVWHMDTPGQYFMELAAAHFAADGPVKLTLTARRGSLGQPVLRTVGQDLPAQLQGDTLSFTLPGAGHYYVQLPALASSNGTFTVAFWVEDLQRVAQTRARFQTPGVVNISQRGVRPDPVLDQTATLQAVLDQGGDICFPPGVYRVGTLRLRSNTTVYLAPGAVLRAVDRKDDVGAEFLAIENARNVTLCGPGTLDANSLNRPRGHNVHHVNISSSHDVTFEDVVFEESNSWAIHIRKSDRFTARNVKVFSGKDGFDPDSSRDVRIERAFVVSADDAIAVKNRFPDDTDGKTTERVTFRDSIVTTIKSALKIGTETRGPIRDVTFENCDVFDGDRGIVLYARDGGPIERATWRNIRLFMRNWPQEKDSGAVFHLNVERREAATPVRDCRIENVTANWIYRSEFAGLADAPLSGVTLRNIHAKVEPPKTGKPALFVCRDNVDLKLDGLTVDWQGNRAQWAGVTSGEGLAVSESDLPPANRNASNPSTPKATR